ncbi:MAG: hypothetical protein AAGI10_09150 [Pseudomonadota bacterium]
MRTVFALAALVVLGACTAPVPNSGAPDSGSGVGFGTADDFRAQQAARDAALEGTAGSALDDQTAEAVDSVIPDTTEAGAATATSEDLLNSGRTGGISDEQNFDAVSGRETIESDAARIAAQREQFQVIQPTALPTRTGSGANIVAFALSTSHPVGQQVYGRSGLTSQNRFQRNCAQYGSPDQAQQAFLEAGGPERDRRGLDPDGDGFACAWDPSPFRGAAG